jgi:hypothetical protein
MFQNSIVQQPVGKSASYGKEPEFIWWVNHTMKKKKQLIKAVK